MGALRRRISHPAFPLVGLRREQGLVGHLSTGTLHPEFDAIPPKNKHLSRNCLQIVDAVWFSNAYGLPPCFYCQVYLVSFLSPKKAFALVFCHGTTNLFFVLPLLLRCDGWRRVDYLFWLKPRPDGQRSCCQRTVGLETIVKHRFWSIRESCRLSLFQCWPPPQQHRGLSC